MKPVRLLVLALLLVCFALFFASCEGKTTLGTEAELVGASGFTKEGTALSLTVPNGTESYSFVDKIEVSPGATWQISADPNGMGYSLTKTVSIHDGDNDYYLFVTSEDGKTVNRYTVSIRCEAEWYVVKDGVITGVTASFRTYAKNVEIPSEVNGEKITGIGEWAFRGCSGLTSVTIGNSVTSIGYMAFCNCSGLTGVYYTGDIAGWCGISFGSSDANPLNYAHNLYINGELVTDLVIPDSVTSIGNYAFYNCTGLTSVTIPDGVTSIGNYAFYGCTGLTSITIPNSVTSIGNYAFSGCTGLTSVTIPNSVKSIGEYAFAGCTGLTSIIIPDGVKSIGDNAFLGCTGLTSVTIGNGVTRIGDSAFYGCTGLTSITIPNSVTSIGNSAFYGCTGLTSITYQSIKAQWNAISKGYYWNENTGNYTVHCTDGDITKGE